MLTMQQVANADEDAVARVLGEALEEYVLIKNMRGAGRRLISNNIKNHE